MLNDTDRKRAIGYLNNLIKLDRDAVIIYGLAVERLQNRHLADKLSRYKFDHQRHLDKLHAKVHELGGSPSRNWPLSQLTLRVKLLVGALGGDSAILRIVKNQEDKVSRVYEYTLSELRGLKDVDLLVQRNLQDNRIHRAWMAEALSH